MWVWKSLLLLFALQTAASCADLLIENITVVDVTTGAELPKRSVLIHNTDIAAIGTHVRAPKAARVINGTGKFLIPGLWDMHVHLWYRENQFPLYLAHGITGVRDMGSNLSWVNQWRDQIKAGKLLGPHIETCGPPVNGTASNDPKLPVLVVHGPNDARTTFDRLDDLEVNFVKVLSGVPRDAYFALIERARKWYVPVAGHVPDAVSLMEAIDARQKSIEHMSGALLACSTHEEKIRNRLLLAEEKQDTNAYTELHAEILDTFDTKQADEVFQRMGLFDTREVPTLGMLSRRVFNDPDKLVADPRLAYISPEIRKHWPDPRESVKKIAPRTLEIARAEYRKERDLLPVMKRAGVKIMAGTDTGDPYTLPGWELHRELQLLVEAGLTPLDALRAATIEPAKFLAADEVLGWIDAGKTADLVLLDGDPLKDIRNTQKIAAVVLGGKYLPKTQLNAMLAASRSK